MEKIRETKILEREENFWSSVAKELVLSLELRSSWNDAIKVAKNGSKSVPTQTPLVPAAARDLLSLRGGRSGKLTHATSKTKKSEAGEPMRYAAGACRGGEPETEGRCSQPWRSPEPAISHRGRSQLPSVETVFL